MLDLNFVRQQFPAFSEPSLKDSAFFENAGGSYLCKDVIEALNNYYQKTKVQPYHPYSQAQLAGKKMDDAYAAIAQWLNTSADEIYFGPSTSQNTYVLANAMLGWLKPGDEIIVTNQDHEANSGVWRNLSRQGITVVEWCVDKNTGSLDINKLRPLISEKTKLLIFPHCSNILGEVNAVAHIAKIAEYHDVKTLVDGVSYAGHGLPDIRALNVDIYLFSLYKVYGPHQGVMVIRKDMDDLLTNQGHFFNSDLREKKLSPAGPDHAQIAASIGVSMYFNRLYDHHFPKSDALSQRKKAKRIRTLLLESEKITLEPLLSFLNSHPKVRIIGPNKVANRAPTVSILVKGHSSMHLARALGQQGIMCGAGHFYSLRLLKAMEIDTQDGVLRFSLVHYTSLQDIEKLIAKLTLLID